MAKKVIYKKATPKQVVDKQIDELQQQVIRLETRIEELEKNKNKIEVVIKQEPWYLYPSYPPSTPYVPTDPPNPWIPQITWCNKFVSTCGDKINVFNDGTTTTGAKNED